MADPSRRTDGRWARSTRVLAVLVAVLMSAAVAGYFAVRAAVRRKVLEGVASIERVTGRHASASDVRVSIGSQLRVEIRGLRIDAAPTDPRRTPLVRGADVSMSLSLLPLLRNRGAQVEIDEIAIERARIEVVRRTDGSFSTDDVVRRAREFSAAQRSRRQDLRSIGVRLFRGRESVLEFVEIAGDGAEHRVAVREVRFEARDVHDGAPMHVTAGGRLGEASAPPFAVSADLVAARDAPRIDRIDFRAADLVLDPILALDVARAAPVVRGHGSFDVHVTGSRNSTSQFGVTTDIRLEGLAPRDAHAHGGTLPDSFAASFATRAEIDRDAGSVRAESFAVALDGMRLDGSVDVRDLRSSPRVESLDVTSTGIRVERLVPLIPHAALPRNARFEGPLELHAHASGAGTSARADGTLDLTGASFETTDVRKPAGVPLVVDFHASTADRVVTIDRSGIRFGPMNLALSGVVGPADRADLTFDTGLVPLDAMFPFFPTARRDLGGRPSLGGTLRIAGDLHREARTTRAHISASTRAVRFDLGRFAFEGDADVRAEGNESGGHQSLVVDAEATHAALRIEGRVDKPAGVPLRLRAEARRNGHTIDVTSLAFETAGLTLRGRGRGTPSRGRIEADVASCEIDVAALVRVVPALRSRVPASLADASARFALRATYDPHAPADGEVHLSSLSFHTPYTELRGRFDLTGFDPPRRIAFDLDIDHLDLAAIDRAGTVRPGAAHAARAARLPPWLETVSLDGAIHAREITRNDLVLSAIDLRARIDDGRVSFPTARLRYADGAIDLSRSTWQLTGTHRIELHARADNLDLDRIGIADERRAHGRISLDGDLMGSTDDPDPSRTFVGSVHVSSNGLTVQRVVTPVVSLDNPLLSRFSLRARPTDAQARQPVQIQRLDGRVRLDAGMVRSIAPVTVESDLGRFEVQGSANLDGHLDLTGSVEISPDAIWEQSNHRLRPLTPVPLRVHITGEASEPHVTIIDLGATIRSLAGAGIRAIGERIRERFRH